MRVPARDGIKRVIIIAFFFAASAVEFGTYPVASVVEFRVQAPRFPTSSHRKSFLSARARERATATASATRFGEAFGYSWTVEARARETDGRNEVEVRAARTRGLGLTSTRMFAFTVVTRTGVSAQSMRDRLVGTSGRELPTSAHIEQSLVESTLSTAELTKIPGASGEHGDVDLVIRVRLWSNPFHVVFKDEVYDVATILGLTTYASVLILRGLSELRDERERRRAARKVRLMRSEIAQLESVANEKADKLRILSAIARVPFVAVFETVQIPMRVVDWTASAISDILIETANLVLIVILLLMPPSRENAPMASSENHAKQATGSKHNRKHRQRPPRSPKRRSELDPKSEHARKESMDILLKRFVIAEEDMDEERQRAAKDAIGHAQAQMRAKMKRDRITDMRLRDSKQRESEDFAAELFANVPGLSVGTRDMRPMSPSSSDTHERQASWELHNRQKSLIHHMLQEIDGLELPPDSKTTVPIEEPVTPKSSHTKNPSFARVWNAPTGF